MFVLMGNFHSTDAPGSSTDHNTLRDDFTALANLIDQYPRVKDVAKFVLVPGPGDPGPGAILPQPPIPAFFTKELQRLVPSAVMATNPCRIRFYTQEVVVFRWAAGRCLLLKHNFLTLFFDDVFFVLLL